MLSLFLLSDTSSIFYNYFKKNNFFLIFSNDGHCLLCIIHNKSHLLDNSPNETLINTLKIIKNSTCFKRKQLNILDLQESQSFEFPIIPLTFQLLNTSIIRQLTTNYIPRPDYFSLDNHTRKVFSKNNYADSKNFNKDKKINYDISTRVNLWDILLRQKQYVLPPSNDIICFSLHKITHLTKKKDTNANVKYNSSTITKKNNDCKVYNSISTSNDNNACGEVTPQNIHAATNINESTIKNESDNDNNYNDINYLALSPPQPIEPKVDNTIMDYNAYLRRFSEFSLYSSETFPYLNVGLDTSTNSQTSSNVFITPDLMLQKIDNNLNNSRLDTTYSGLQTNMSNNIPTSTFYNTTSETNFSNNIDSLPSEMSMELQNFILSPYDPPNGPPNSALSDDRAFDNNKPNESINDQYFKRANESMPTILKSDDDFLTLNACMQSSTHFNSNVSPSLIEESCTNKPSSSTQK